MSPSTVSELSPVVGAAICAWALSQLTKLIFALVRLGREERSRIAWRLVWAGGMPSSHSAFATATLLTIGWSEGLRSPLFGLAFVVAVVMIYDRSKLYHIYVTLQQRFPTLGAEVARDPVLKDLVGHTPVEVIVGVAVGAVAAVVLQVLLSAG